MGFLAFSKEAISEEKAMYCNQSKTAKKKNENSEVPNEVLRNEHKRCGRSIRWLMEEDDDDNAKM